MYQVCSSLHDLPIFLEEAPHTDCLFQASQRVVRSELQDICTTHLFKFFLKPVEILLPTCSPDVCFLVVLLKLISFFLAAISAYWRDIQHPLSELYEGASFDWDV